MKKLLVIIGLAAAARLAVPAVQAADPGRWDGPDLKANTNTIASLTNVWKTLFATNAHRVGIWLSSTTGGASVWAGINRTNAAVGDGVLLQIDQSESVTLTTNGVTLVINKSGPGGLFLPVEKIGKGPFTIIGTNATSGTQVSGTELQTQR